MGLNGPLRPAERVVGGLLVFWAALALAHTGFAMARQHGWALERTPASSATLGVPDEERAPLVAGVREAIERGGAAARAAERLVVVLPADADTVDVVYTRYQLAHLEYPLRVTVVRDVPGSILPERVPEGAVAVRASPEAARPFPLRRAGEALRP